MHCNIFLRLSTYLTFLFFFLFVTASLQAQNPCVQVLAGAPNETTCNNAGTANGLDDLICVTNFLVFYEAGLSGTYDVLFSGAYCGTYNFQPEGTNGFAQTIEVNVPDPCFLVGSGPPYEFVFIDNAAACQWTIMDSNPLLPCEPCADADNDNICDDVDPCPFQANLVPGDNCPDDGDPCTINGQLDANCNCTYVVEDSDGDGVCDANDTCPNFDNSLIGTVCDDGDVCTTGDVIGNDCVCLGVFADADNDGVCDTQDICPAFDDSLNETTCDDGDDCTIGDVYTGPNCTCQGVVVDTDGDSVCDFYDLCPNFDDALIGSACDDNDPCTTNDIYTPNCQCLGAIADADLDGVCDANDNCPNFDNSLIGTPCDDGDPCTISDVWGTDCACAGLYADTDGDGVCDANDQCQGVDDTIDNNNNGFPDGCESPGPGPGTGGPTTCITCPSNASDTNYEWIENVRFGPESNWSGDNNGYADFSGNPYDFYSGYYYYLKIRPGFSHYSYWEHFRVWIDWNQDCDFDDADEFIGQATHWGSVYDYVSVPQHALSGLATMRISMSYNGYQNSCDVFQYGEVEDYALNVINANNPGNAPVQMMPELYSSLFDQAQYEIAQEEAADALMQIDYVGKEIDRMEGVASGTNLVSDTDLNVYPNPVIDYATISLGSLNNFLDVNVLDSQGRIVFRSTNLTHTNILRLETADYPAGVYTVVIGTEDRRVVTKKFVVLK